jgi:ribonuclease-3
MSSTEIAELESILGHQFREPRWLEQALMHSSRIPERSAEEPVESNEKLEFLGDAVLELIVSEELVREFPHWSEGQLSKSRARLVNATAISLSARRLGIGKYLHLGRGEEKTGGRQKHAILADSFEALIAAVYLDGGIEPARTFILSLFGPLVASAGDRAAEASFTEDWKSAFQEWSQANGRGLPHYRLASVEGPDHRKRFEIEVSVGGEVVARAGGKSKKEAEQQAAKAALSRFQ